MAACSTESQTTQYMVPEEPSWVQFQNTVQAFLDETHESDATARKCLGDGFDDLFNRIKSAALAKQQRGDSSPKPKETRAVLQAFCKRPQDPEVRLMTYLSFRESLDLDGTGRNTKRLLRKIQWQITLRLMLWERMGNKPFVTAWEQEILHSMSSKQRRHAKKQAKRYEHSWKICVEDITSFVSLGLVKGARTLTGLTSVEPFLNSCGLKYIRHNTSWKLRLIKDIWTFFDLVEDADSTIKVSPKEKQPTAVLPPLPVLDDESVKSKAIASCNSTNREKEAESYFDEKVKLTAPKAKKPNSILGKSARSRFVGSHFNTNLTNMSAFFRTVPGQFPACKRKKPVVRKRPVVHSSVTDSSPSKARGRVQVIETPAPQRKRSRAVWETPNDLRVPRVLRL